MSSLYLPQWGCHSSWISTGPNTCWTTHVTSTSTRRRVSQWVSGGSFLRFPLLRPFKCMNRTGVYALIYKRALGTKPAAHLETQACLFTSLSVSPLSLFLFVSHRHTLPASQWEEAAGRSPEWHRETLGDGRPVIIYLHGNTGTRWDERRGTGPWIDPNGVEWVSEAPEFIAGTMNAGACGLGVNESERRSVVCLHSFMFSCHFCRAMSHRVKLVKVRCLFF